jgi:hypothetical protein
MNSTLRKQVKDRAQDRCEGEYTRKNGHEVVRTGNCFREGMEPCHIDHAGMGGAKSAHRLDNLLWLCRLHHDFMDERITPREYNRLRSGL